MLSSQTGYIHNLIQEKYCDTIDIQSIIGYNCSSEFLEKRKMAKTRHIHKRMSQRSIKQQLINLTLNFGRAIPCKGARKYYLTRKNAQQTLGCLDELRRAVLEAIDKGGLVLVTSEGGTEITTYRLNSYRRKGRK